MYNKPGENLQVLFVWVLLSLLIFEDKGAPFLPVQEGHFSLEGLMTCFRGQGQGVWGCGWGDRDQKENFLLMLHAQSPSA